MRFFLAGEGAPGWREDQWWAVIDRRLVSFYHSARLGTFIKMISAWEKNRCEVRQNRRRTQ